MTPLHEIAAAEAALAEQEPTDKKARLRAFVSEHTLDEVVGNVRRNNPWETEKRLKEIEDEVRKHYQAVQLLTEPGRGERTVARETGLPLARIKGWIYKVLFHGFLAYILDH